MGDGRRTFLAALVSAGTVGAPGVFIVPLQHDSVGPPRRFPRRFDPLHSVRLMAPFAAALMNRYGLRNVTLSAC